MKEIFDLEDIDGDGWVNKHQLGKIMRSFGIHPYPTDEELTTLYDEFDPDGNDGLELSDVLDIVSRSSSKDTETQGLIEAFKLFDRDGKGLLTAEKLLHVMQSLGVEFTVDDSVEMVKRYDADGDNSINYEEFVLMMK